MSFPAHSQSGGLTKKKASKAVISKTTIRQRNQQKLKLLSGKKVPTRYSDYTFRRMAVEYMRQRHQRVTPLSKGKKVSSCASVCSTTGGVTNRNEIRDNIFKTLLYYNVFRHPLTAEELYAFYPKSDITKEAIQKELDTTVAENNSLIGTHKGYYFISSNKDDVEERLRKEDISLKQWKVARIMTMIIKIFPFVRGVFVTGTLSKNSSDENSDIDFLIICEENRPWIARTFIRLFSNLFRLNKKKLLCANYLLSKSNLTIKDRNVFTATEIAHIKVMYNKGILDNLLKNNKWIKEYFPNLENTNHNWHLPPLKMNDKNNITQSFFELLFPKIIGDLVDDFLLKTLGMRLKTKFSSCLGQNIKLSKSSVKIHGLRVDHREVTLKKYKELFRQHDIPHHKS